MAKKYTIVSIGTKISLMSFWEMRRQKFANIFLKVFFFKKVASKISSTITNPISKQVFTKIWLFNIARFDKQAFPKSLKVNASSSFSFVESKIVAICSRKEGYMRAVTKSAMKFARNSFNISFQRL